jgi:hypothetical protein
MTERVTTELRVKFSRPVLDVIDAPLTSVSWTNQYGLCNWASHGCFADIDGKPTFVPWSNVEAVTGWPR